MPFSSSAFRAFYATRIGRLAARFIFMRLRDIWSDVRHHSLLAMGYPQPYLSEYCRQSERTVILSPPSQDAVAWPDEGKNLLGISKPTLLPFSYETFDRILIVHALEFTDNLPECLQECWRVLKPNGRMMIIVPNRMSIWARTEKCPFAYGAPFSFAQIRDFLVEHNFCVERHRKALFLPPFETKLMLSLSPFLEKIGYMFFKTFGGVHIIEVSKKVFAPIKPDRGSAIEAAARILIPQKPVPNNFGGDEWKD
ncbi:MAG: class I SAM-dependent methyltransferase [Rhodospirillales bacterium]|nr:class I SAM-dependent methyltransferase [Rhodospirillales bacterium]MCB9973589.1 class I SAM-dependent methyltransferase [Rhodospirillales bacterium]MCB9979607.1 class I SAM-dependent methyltransferase [Rhodospirillales bacterium]